MRVAVLGLSDFGFNVAYWLSALGNEVLAVDRDSELVQRIQGEVGKAVVANITDRTTLEELGIGDMDVALMATGRRLETLVMLTHYLTELGVPRILVKVTSEEQEKIVRLIGATDVVQPDRESAARAAARLTFPHLIDYVVVGDHTRLLVTRPPKHFVGKALADLELDRRHIDVLAVRPHGEGAPMAHPPGEYVVAEDDVLVLMGAVTDLVAKIR